MDRGAKWICCALRELAETAVKTDGEYQRATYTREDRMGLELLQRWMRERGMETCLDGVGNLFGRIEGKSKKIVLTGSHRDTVRGGGKYDGALGLLASLEAVGELSRELGTPNKTVEVVATCEEEGNRFLSAYVGSRAIVGALTEEHLREQDEEGNSLAAVLAEQGYWKGELPGPKKDLERFVELHIEQGPVLEQEKKEIGIVTSIVGILAGTVRFSGQQNHAGTTPMRLRKDPVPPMCEFVSRIGRWAGAYSDRMVFTVGSVRVLPGAPNVIAAGAEITFDIRSIHSELLDAAQETLISTARAVREDFGERVGVELIWAGKDMPVEMDGDGISLLTRIAEEKGASLMLMCSGAGHDSQVIGGHVKTNMLFVPSVNGVSHSAEEYTSENMIETGYLVLKEFLKKIAWESE